MRSRRVVAAVVLGALVVLGCGAGAIAVLTGGHGGSDRTPGRTASRPSADEPAPEPVVRGNQIVDDRDGTAFVPHGVNWSSFEYACTQGWGYSELDRLGGATAGEQEAGAIAAWGANTVRLPVNQDCWLGTRGAPVSDGTTTRTAEGYQAAVRGFVADLHKAGLAVILDLQSRKRLDQDDFGNVAMPDQDSLEFWRSAAAEFADDPSTIFDAFNEPYSRYDNATGGYALDLTWDCWADGGCQAPVQDDRSEPLDGQTYTAVGMTAVVAAIRSTGATQPILLGGLDYANDLSGWLDHAPRDPQLIASVHEYPFKPCKDTSCWDRTLAPLAASVPLLVGEVGDDDKNADFVDSLVSWADQHSIGWLAWVWDDSSTNAMALVRSDRSTPTDPYGIRVRQLLQNVNSR